MFLLIVGCNYKKKESTNTQGNKQKQIVDNFGKEFWDSLKIESNSTRLKPDTSIKIGYVVKEKVDSNPNSVEK